MRFWPIFVLILLYFLIARRGDVVAGVANARYRQGMYPKALRIFRTAEKIGKLSLENRMTYGYVCLRCGDLSEARRILQLCSNDTPRDSANRKQIRNLLALVSWKEGNLEEAIEILEDIIESGFKNTLIYQNLGIFYNLAEDKEKALAFAQEAYGYNADDPIICDNLADAYAGVGDWEKSAEVYKALVETEPRFPEAYYGYGKTLIALGKQEEGRDFLEKSLTKPFSYLSVRPKEEILELCKSYGIDTTQYE